jgi:ABC-type multidrug transport system fused ATPase/permease subunit
LFGNWISIGDIFIAFFTPLWVASGAGVFYLRKRLSALTEAQVKSRQDHSRLRSSTVSGMRASEGEMGKSSHHDQRQLSTMRITKNTQLLGSLKEKKETRINIEVDKLGLRLNSNKRVVLAGVDGKIEAGSVTAIMGPSGAGKVCDCDVGIDLIVSKNNISLLLLLLLLLSLSLHIYDFVFEKKKKNLNIRLHS